MTKFMTVALSALLCGMTIVASAQAQPSRFGLFFGDQQSDFVPEFMICLSDYQVRQAVADRGYTDIYLNVMHDKHVEVRATRAGWVYLLDFNYCTGRVESRRQLRPAS